MTNRVRMKTLNKKNQTSDLTLLSDTQRVWKGALLGVLAVFGTACPARAQIDVVALATDLFNGFDVPLINDNGTIVFRGQSTNGKAGVYLGSSAGYLKLAEEGTVFESIAAATLSDQGITAFLARAEPILIDGKETVLEGLFVGNNPAQDFLDRQFNGSDKEPPIGINDDLHYFWVKGRNQRAHFDNPGETSERTSWAFGRLTLQEIILPYDINGKGQIAFVSRTNGLAPYQLRRAEEPVALLQGGFKVEMTDLASGFESIGQCSIDGSGRVAFVGKEPGQPSGLYIASSGAPVLFLSDGDGNHFRSVEAASLSRGGQIAFKARYAPPDGRARSGIYKGLNGATDKIVANGDRVFILGKEWEISIGNFGPRGFNNAGQAVFEGSIRSLDNSNESIDGIFVTAGVPDPPEEDPPPGTIYHWKGPSATSPSGAFNVASNWQPEGVPVKNDEKADTAVFNLNSDYTVTGPTPKTERLVILDGTMNLSVGTYEAPATSLEEPSVTVGGGGKLNLVGGSLESAHATIGWSAGPLAETHLFNNGTAWNNQGLLRVGQLSPGHLFVANGATLTTGKMWVGDSADGSVVVGGGGIMSLDSLFVGLNGAGSFEVEAGGQVVLETLKIGQNQSATGLVVVTGVSLADGEPSTITMAGPVWAEVGVQGPGELRVEEGGLFEAAGSANVSVGSQLGKGQLLIRGVHPSSGLPSTLAFVPGPFDQAHLWLGGFVGNGELAIEDGARAITDNVVVGGGGSGTARVVGVGANGASFWSANRIEVGTTSGTGMLDVKAGGLLQVKALDVGVKGNPSGSAGEIRIAGRDQATGTPSTLKVYSSEINIGKDSGTGLVQVVDGGLLDAFVLGLWVGFHGKGQLLVSGFDAASGLNSRLQMDGFGVQVGVGAGGEGELVVTNGAWMSAPKLTVGLEGNGTVHVTGSGGGDPSWLSIEEELKVGTDSGTGVVTVSEGGVITVGSAPPLGDTLRVGPGGLLSGTGTIFGNVEVLGATSEFTGGVVFPGSSPGTLTIQGNLIQHSNSLMVIEVRGTTAGTRHDQIVVTGNAELRGTMLLIFQNGFAPRTGNQLRLFDLPGGTPATLPAVQIQNLAPGFNYVLATSGGKLTLIANNNATFVPPAATLRVDGIRVVSGGAELSVQSNLDFGSFGVQASGDLASWENIGQVQLVRGAGRFVDPNLPSFSRLFYRILMNP